MARRRRTRYTFRVDPRRGRDLRVVLIAAAVSAAASVGCGAPGDGATSGDDPTSGWDFELKLEPVDLAPGEERFVCSYRPADGVDRWLHAFSTVASPGVHHVSVMRVHDKGLAAYGPVECFGPDDVARGVEGLLPGLGQQIGGQLTLPEGVAIEVGPDEGLYVQEHVLNASGARLTATATWRASTLAPADVVEPAGLAYVRRRGFTLPPGESTVGERCKISRELRLILATGHMHSLGLEFTAHVDGRRVVDGTDWSEPDVHTFGEGLAVPSGSPLDFACTYGNATGRDVPEGRLFEDEMCVFVGIYRPLITPTPFVDCD
jgi:hypothetical protein